MKLNPEDLLGESGLTLEEVQKERKEYVKNIGIEYRYGCYEEKRADSCHLLAEYREAIEQHFKSAFRLYKENCEERKYGKSCLKYAQYLFAGRECESNITEMIEPLKVACGAKLAPACKLLGLVYWNGGEQEEPDAQSAEKYQRIACDMDDGEACWMLSTWYMGPDVQFKKRPSNNKKEQKMVSLPRDMQKSIEYGARACENNVYQSCANLSRIYKLGDGVPKDLDKAKEYADKAHEIVNNLKEGISPGFTA